MIKQQIGATVYQYSLIIIILAAIGFRGGRDFIFHKNEAEVTVDLKDLQQIFPEADYYTENRYGAFDIYGNNRDKIGSVLLSSNYSQEFGYGGRVPLLIGVDDNLAITKVALLPNNETGDYIEAIYGDEFIGKWEGVNLEDAIQLQVDVISGATQTSNAVITGVRQTASSVMDSGASVVSETSLWATAKDILFMSVILLSLVMVYKKGMAKYRIIYQVSVLLIMGVILNNALSVRLLHGWLQEGFVWRANWQSSVVFMLALSISFIGKRKFYCNYLCPMGALQELTNHFTPFKKRTLPTRFKGITVREIYLVLIAGSLLLGFTPELSHLEPFMFFSFRIVGIGLIIFGLIVILLSLFYRKPWCAVCPTGCALDTISYKKTKGVDL
ncbi:MAG TPA: 4Fe-4S binding protein [Bacteroidales bacterium]|nr:4Fe-4S binding protein [Bacteroidales bacterium]